MTLTPGTRLGPYEIVAPLGAGGITDKNMKIGFNLSRAWDLFPAAK